MVLILHLGRPKQVNRLTIIVCFSFANFSIVTCLHDGVHMCIYIYIIRYSLFFPTRSGRAFARLSFDRRMASKRKRSRSQLLVMHFMAPCVELVIVRVRIYIYIFIFIFIYIYI